MLKKSVIKEEQGFTLVEIIVVLVVLAILAAFTIPTMLGFVADAKGKAYIAEAREVYVAAQATVTEYSGTTNMTDGNNNKGIGGRDKWSNGLGVSVSSGEVQYRHEHYTDSTLYPPNNSSQIECSHQMYRYLSADLPFVTRSDTSISLINLLLHPDDLPTGHRAAWIVTVGPGPDKIDGTGSNALTRTGKVTKLVYLRDGYKVTIEGENTIVEKYQVPDGNERHDFGHS
ncbi:prepilin-type N-terminal cleavage/methylation domain-containing protein [Acetobacterium wieringae]|uniref:prepilin-type N-terminal cleavage/methylation domain-containing protein n=1 Tax=Acetobacterium wieringae TaxID=52694 RepID=UPI002B1FF310|nr:prepilin-type N-terminal cleavage/methylation domain-containing protein [Acetobacterium wieringae]MEA4807044.1 prepilin-type N-terminal cleavage/methylation domain-containing protein [Acetobacterium wieringae]